ncbi:serine/threonine protein phosphatase, partial [Mesorhizobium sp. M4B.F.Ca.ET.088.02.2.1]
ANGFGTVVDLAAELERPARASCRWISLAVLDLMPPAEKELSEAVQAIEAARRQGTVLICCALGFQRSATVAAAWLVGTGRSHTAAQARKLLAASGRPVHIQAGEAA